MKHITITALIFAAALSFSCSNWLDVKPKTEVKSDVMFEREQGFKDAIIGCYMQMSNANLYGKELTACFMEVAARQYSVTNVAGNVYYTVNLLDWTQGTVRSIMDNTWSGTYNVIANVNNIIENIDLRREVLHPTSYQIIKGEAYGLRGFLHFELLRRYGYGDLVNHPEYLKKMTIPYSRSYNKVFAEQYTGENVIEMAIDDLETAVSLLERYDPWSTESKADDYALVNDDGFFTNRSTRFNYWAARATLARIYMWTGEYDKALPILQDFLDNRSGITGLAWVTDQHMSSANDAAIDFTFSMEHIFRLDVNKLWETNLRANYDPKFNPMGENAQLLYLTQTEMKARFEVPDSGDKIGASDYRYTKQLSNTETQVAVRKFIDFENYQYPNRMPLIKLAEMYYMAAECHLAAGRTGEAVKLLNEVRDNRNISPVYNIPEDATADAVQAELLKEWRKEFLGEGQMFYYYKRTGATAFGSYVLPDPLAVYVMPIPESEITTGGRVNNLPEENENQ